MTDPRYHYQCLAFETVDGDTLDITIDLGVRINHQMRVRLAGVNAPELRGGSDDERQAALRAREFVHRWCYRMRETLMAHTQQDKADKYGRMLVTLYHLESGETLQDAMIKAGHAVAYDGQSARKPWGSA
jgi:micrococcal nuclease